MKMWVLSQFGTEPVNGWEWPVAASYSNGHICPQHPTAPETWALVLCNDLHNEAAAADPRVQVFHTVWDMITPETVTAYQDRGAKAGMMLCQLLSLLAQEEPGYRAALT
jgi:hypothetical protein